MKQAKHTFQIATPSGVVSVSVGDQLPDADPAVKAAPHMFKPVAKKAKAVDAGDGEEN